MTGDTEPTLSVPPLCQENSVTCATFTPIQLKTAIYFFLVVLYGHHNSLTHLGLKRLEKCLEKVFLKIQQVSTPTKSLISQPL